MVKTARQRVKSSRVSNMKLNRIITVGTVMACLLGLIGVTVADLLDAQAGNDTSQAGTASGDSSVQPQGNAPGLPVIVQPPPRPSGKRGQALRLDPEGFVVGTVSYVDPYTLNLEPVPDAVVTFMQNMLVVAQTKTGSDGRFAVKGLTEHAAVSVFVRSREWVCMFGTFIETWVPNGEKPVAADNQLVFTAQPNAVQFAEEDPRFQVIQCVPYQDFISAFRMGLFGDLCAGVTDVPVAFPGPRGDGSRGYVEGAYAAAAAAAIAGAIAAAEDEFSTPFDP
jgi:hypothetical protein